MISPIKPFYQRIAGNALYLFIATGLTNVAMFSANVLLARWLGVEAYGTLAFLLSVVSVARLATDLGLPTAATKRIAEELGRDSGSIVLCTTIRSFQRAIWQTGGVGALVCGFLVTAGSFSLLAGLHMPGIWLIGFWVLVPAVAKSFIAVFMGFEDMHYALLGYLLQEPLKLGILLLLLFTGALSLPTLIWFWTLTYLIAWVVIVAVGRHFLATRVGASPSEPWRWVEIVDRLRESIVYFLPYVGITIMPSLIAIILGLVSTKTEIAWFAASASLASISFLVLRPVANALLPAFAHRYARTGQAIAPAEGEQLLRMLALFNVAVLLGFLLLGRLIFRWTYGAAFNPAVAILMVLVATNFFESFRLVADPLLNSINAAATVSRIELVRYGIMLPAVIGLGWWRGALGAAGGVLLASLACNAIRLYALQNRLEILGVQFAPRFVVWVGAVLASWQLGVPAWGIAPAAVLLGWGLGLYQLADLQLALRMVPPLVRFG